MENINENFLWITMNPGGHFADLHVKDGTAKEENLSESLYAYETERVQIENLCNLIKALILANYDKASDWYPDLPDEYRELIPKLQFKIDEIKDNK